MSISFTCIRCKTVLNVPDDTPSLFTCPVCLARNTRTDLAGVPMALPVDNMTAQAEKDSQKSLGIILIVAAVIVLGIVGFLSSSYNGSNGASLIYLLALIGMIGLCAMLVERSLRQRNSPAILADDKPLDPPPPVVPGQLQPLQYQTRRQVQPTNPWAIVRGFFLAIAVCIGGMIFMIATLDKSHSNPLIPLIAITAFIATAIYAGYRTGQPGHRGFGIGAAIGLVLGGIALLPCGFCYLLFAGK